MALRVGENTTLTLGYEHFEDERTADRGVPSFQAAARSTSIPSTFFGDPDRSRSEADVDAFTALLEHDFGNGLTLRNRTRSRDYDKFYQNIFPGAVRRQRQHGGDLGLQQRHAAREPCSTRPT